MKSDVVETYENYREEDRLTTNNARKIEFITTARVFDELIKGHNQILDCAAGTGAYAFYLADQGNEVTATDITPRHVEIMNEQLKTKEYQMKTAVLDACNMEMFADVSFDVVLNMGPFYHLIDENQRRKCFEESMRVLRKGGLLITAYIPRYYIFQHIALKDIKYLDEAFQKQLMETGVMRSDDEKCFWTDSYYSTKEEMEELYESYGMSVVDHFAQDGLAPEFSKAIDQWDEQQFKIWLDYHYSVCREQSILGASNHVIIVGRK